MSFSHLFPLVFYISSPYHVRNHVQRIFNKIIPKDLNEFKENHDELLHIFFFKKKSSNSTATDFFKISLLML
jgi:hypothetical protein